MVMKTTIAFLLCSIGIIPFAGMSHDDHKHPQYEPKTSGALTVNIEVVDVEVTEVIESSLKTKFRGKDLKSEREVLETQTAKVPAIFIVADSVAKFVNVNVFTIMKDQIQQMPLQSVEDRQYLLIAPPGKYSIHIDTFDPDKGIDKIVYPVEIPGDQDQPEPDPGEPDPGSGDFAALAKLSADMARKLDDDPTRVAIVTEIGKILPVLSSDEVKFKDALSMIQGAIVKGLATRIGPSLEKDWYGIWRKPLDDAFTKSGIKTKENLVAAWTEINAALTKGFKTVIPKQKTLSAQKQPTDRTYRVGDIVNGYKLVEICDGAGNCNLEWVPLKGNVK